MARLGLKVKVKGYNAVGATSREDNSSLETARLFINVSTLHLTTTALLVHVEQSVRFVRLCLDDNF